MQLLVVCRGRNMLEAVQGAVCCLTGVHLGHDILDLLKPCSLTSVQLVL